MATNLVRADWQKSSRSAGNGNCVEVATNLVGADWQKSSRSQSNGACVEVAGNLGGVVGVRDSKDPGGPALTVAPAAWAAFADEVRRGALDA
ncbi:DUF397 domain-containing protein [Actinocatenispora rupis]|uniref:DUF397 domain-containing protein n=1 Tax=Actinocatenispora rupis TaxID=519421 RepID=UPI003CD0A0F1